MVALTGAAATTIGIASETTRGEALGTTMPTAQVGTATVTLQTGRAATTTRKNVTNLRQVHLINTTPPRSQGDCHSHHRNKKPRRQDEYRGQVTRDHGHRRSHSPVRQISPEDLPLLIPKLTHADLRNISRVPSQTTWPEISEACNPTGVMKDKWRAPFDTRAPHPPNLPTCEQAT